MRFLSAILLYISVVLGQCGVAHSATNISWLGEFGASTFDIDEITFGGFYANELVSVGGGLFHTHSPGSVTVEFNLELELNGSWTSVFTATTDSTTLLSSILTNIMFPAATVTGIRMSGTPFQSQSLHVGSATIFTFDVSPVPIPAALPLFATALAGAGVLRWRRKRMASSHQTD